MTTFKSSSELKTLNAPTTKSITFATSSKSNPTESLPAEQRWWTQKFHLGPTKYITKNKSTSSTSTTFQTPSGGSAIISHVSFAPNTIKGYPYQMAIVSGPRVGLYGGTQTSSLFRALARPNKRGNTNAEEEITLFGESDKGVKPDRSVSTGGQPAHCSSYHHDGRLLAVGCENGYIKICDSQSRATLRTFATHGTRGGFTVRSTGWIPETKTKKRMVWSAGDDAVLRIWDLSGDMLGMGDNVTPAISLKGHGDAIRSCVCYTYGEKNDEKSFLVTGSYDHTVRLWDLEGLTKSSDLKDTNAMHDNDESERCMSVMNHGAPVETLLVVHPSKKDVPIIISAGGTTIKLWNPSLGTCLSTIQTKHSKTITSLCLASLIRGEQDDDEVRDGDEVKKMIVKRLISGGLDGLIRIYSADEIFHQAVEDVKKGTPKYNLQYLHGVKTSQPITALAISPDNTRLVVGSSTGYVTVRQRAKYVAQGVKRKAKSDLRAGTYSYFMRGAGVEADTDDHIIMLQKKKKLKDYDVLLQKFRYSDALDKALAMRDSKAIISVLEELGRRRGLVTALSNRDEETLEPLLAFTTSFISNPRYTPLLIGVANQLCDIYSNVFGQSDTIDEYFEKLQIHVKNECKTQSSLLHLIGQIDAVMYAAETSGNEV